MFSVEKLVKVKTTKAPGVEGKKIPQGDLVPYHPFPFEQGVCFPAGLSRKEEKYYTKGGRVLGVTAWGENKNIIKNMAYKHLPLFRGAQWREDIAGDWE